MKDKKDNTYIWWKHGVIYHLYIRSFFDSNNDGIGDLNGVTEKLDYLKELGVDAIWLSPFFKSPQVDFGYDVSNYIKIHPEYGTIDDFKSLIKQAHQRGIRIIIDMILNHTSSQHDWFVESRSSKDNPKRDWYIWQKSDKKNPPNNWRTPFGKKAWEYDKNTNEYYFHSFFKEQPDLNWRNPNVEKALFQDITYWLDLGVDGLRLDVINLIVKDKKLRNNPSFFNQIIKPDEVYSRDRPTSIKIIKSLRQLLDTYENRMCVGEIYALPPGNSKLVGKYMDKGDNALNMAFDFSLIFARWSANKYRKVLTSGYQNIPLKGWPCTVLSNHDLNRNKAKPLFSNHTKIAKLKALLSMTLYGTPFIYYGEEIGMKNVKVPYNKLKDRIGKMYWPFYTGRDKSRTPLHWNSSAHAGFSNNMPWLPVDREYKKYNIDQQSSDKNSILNAYRELIRIRKTYKVFNKGRWSLVSSASKHILAYERKRKDKQLIILLNFSRLPKQTHQYKDYHILFSTNRDNNQLHESLKLAGLEGVILSKDKLI